MAEERFFVVAFKDTGIPFRNQLLMTKDECRDWIKRDVANTQNCGIDVHEEDYEIIDTRKWRS